MERKRRLERRRFFARHSGAGRNPVASVWGFREPP